MAMFDYYHDNPPAPFNLDARPGLGAAVSEAYAKWCDEHQGSTQEDRKRAHAELHDELLSQYPSYGEMDNNER